MAQSVYNFLEELERKKAATDTLDPHLVDDVSQMNKASLKDAYKMRTTRGRHYSILPIITKQRVKLLPETTYCKNMFGVYDN